MYDLEHPSWQKTIAYTMTSKNVPIFCAAFARFPDPTEGNEYEGDV